MKTQIITLAAILLLSINGFAKNAPVTNSDELTVTEMINETFVAEETLSIENWMTNDYSWQKFPVEEATVEAPLEISDWMTNSMLWNKRTAAGAKTAGIHQHYIQHANLNDEKEEPLSIEGWMTDDESWSM